MIGIYMILNTVNNKVYIGQSRHLKERFSRHRRDLEAKTHHNEELQRDYNKYGAESFDFIVLQECEENELYELEQYYIFCLDSSDPLFGYNLTYGGERDIRTERSRKKCTGGHYKRTPEHIALLRTLAVGRTPWNKGMKTNEETRKKQSLAKIGKPAHNRKKVLCIDTGELFESSVNAGKAHGVEPTNIRKCCRRERPFAGGMMWKYI